MCVGNGRARTVKLGKHQSVRSLFTANKIQVGPRDRIDLDDVAGCLESDCRGIARIEITRGAREVRVLVGAVAR